MKIIVVLLLTLNCSVLLADDTSNVAVETSAVKLPIRYISTINEDVLFDELKKFGRFENMSKSDLPGTPIALLITLRSNNTAGGNAAALGSAFWAGSTLGLLPVVTNKDMIVRYELLVNRKKLVDISFSENFTEAKSLFNQRGGKIDKDVLDWVLSTVSQFNSQLDQNEALNNLEDEFSFYFGETSK